MSINQNAEHIWYQLIQEKEQIHGNIGMPKKGNIVILPPVHVDTNDQSRLIVRGSAPRAARIFVITPANELIA